ncbi:MAG: hypothetical protein ABJH82_03190 [Polaribacter sp.]|uniref:hypothetical protein n=1 Tax=Polaribacter sp. TaxID=1920175 RepID=UPI00326771A1
MNKLFLVIIAFISLQSCKQTKVDYLKNNRFDINASNFNFPQKDFKMIGFGAYHGSAKTEDVELKFLESLTKDGTIEYYLPEVDYSTAFYYNKFLKTGDTILLKELVFHNGYHTAQERTIQFYNKWKKLKQINDKLPKENKIKVLGIEWVVGYTYTIKHLLEIFKDNKELNTVNDIKNMMALDTVNLYSGHRGLAHKTLKNFVSDYNSNKEMYLNKVKKPDELEYIIKNLNHSFDKNIEREKLIYENYLDLNKIYDFKNNKQFFRVGFFHLEKSRQGKEGYASLFTRLIENNIHTDKEILSVIGFFMDSHVVWDEIYEKGKYKSYTTEGGFGIGDYEKEYFRGIQLLKDAKISDKTLFRLNLKNSPYANKEPDLIEVILQDKKSNTEAVKGMATLKFLDYAVLISNSKASIPIQEMK